MAIPSLSQFLAYPQGFTLTTPVAQIVDALGQGAKGMGDYIIILDAGQRPIGAIPLQMLWRQAVSNPMQGSLDQHQDWVEPIVQVSAQQTLGAVWPLPPAGQAPPMVAVDETMRYVGIVNSAAVLAWLSENIGIDAVNQTLQFKHLAPVRPVEHSPQRWLAEASHALKNPMTSLLGLSTLLLDQRVGDLNQRQTRYATLIQQAVRRLIGLVNQLLDWSRLDSDQLHFEVETLALNHFVHNLWEAYLAQLPDSQRQAQWTASFTRTLPSEPIVFKADPLRLQQAVHWIFDYLLQHQAIPLGLEASCWGPLLGLTLRVEGATAFVEDAARAWEFPTLITDSVSQTGNLDRLGLWLARRFCQGQGGDLTYYGTSTESCITLLLPLASQSAQATRENPGADTILTLLVCQREDIIEQAVDHLQESPYRLVVARSMSEAEGMIQRLAPTFVLTCVHSFPEAANILGAAQTSLVLSLVTDRATAEAPANQPQWRVWLSDLRETLDQLTKTAAPTRRQVSSITLLLLSPPEVPATAEEQPWLTMELRTWLQHYRCRLLQVDDLTQARILSRVWQPDVILVDTTLPIAPAAWRSLEQWPELSRLPLIMLTDKGLEQGAESHGLRVYHCAMDRRHSPQQMATRLMQMIETALNP